MKKKNEKLNESILNPDEIDIRQTLILNSPWIIYILLFIVFSTMALSICASIKDETIRIIALLGTSFSMLKYLAWIGFPYIKFKNGSELNYRGIGD